MRPMYNYEKMVADYAAAGVEMVEYPEYDGRTMERRAANHHYGVPPLVNEKILADGAAPITSNGVAGHAIVGTPSSVVGDPSKVRF